MEARGHAAAAPDRPRIARRTASEGSGPWVTSATHSRASYAIERLPEKAGNMEVVTGHRRADRAAEPVNSGLPPFRGLPGMKKLPLARGSRIRFSIGSSAPVYRLFCSPKPISARPARCICARQRPECDARRPHRQRPHPASSPILDIGQPALLPSPTRPPRTHRAKTITRGSRAAVSVRSNMSSISILRTRSASSVVFLLPRCD
jgi:hypothetical protein